MIEARLRTLAPQVLGALVRRYPRHFDACEDAVQEALLAASRQWPADGVPDDPRAWLVTVASRRLTDTWRAESARRAREDSVAAAEPLDARVAPGADVEAAAAEEAAAVGSLAAPLAPGDDTLTLLFLCCHPALSPASQIALT
ncbi:MAG TPA: sigma factor, partial [Baekduia sp.]|nr:sigma factor [Baekduia sp.]